MSCYVCEDASDRLKKGYKGNNRMNMNQKIVSILCQQNNINAAKEAFTER